MDGDRYAKVKRLYDEIVSRWPKPKARSQGTLFDLDDVPEHKRRILRAMSDKQSG